MARIRDVVIDSRHPASLARFWAAVLEGYEVAPYDQAELDRLRAAGIDDPEDDPTVLVEASSRGTLRLWFQLVPESKLVKNRGAIPRPKTAPMPTGGSSSELPRSGPRSRRASEPYAPTRQGSLPPEPRLPRPAAESSAPHPGRLLAPTEPAGARRLASPRLSARTAPRSHHR